MKRFAILLLVLVLVLTAASACADGILPVLIEATPVPENFTAVSYHALKKESTPAATLNNGGYRYPYTIVTCDDWDLFGKALAQDGWVLDSSSVSEIGEQNVIVSKNSAELAIDYNPHLRELYVTYPMWVQPLEYDEEQPYTVKADTASILPQLPQTISLPAATGKYDYSGEKVENGYKYSWTSVPYKCYTEFSNKLGEEGYTLVSYEELENGYASAVVAKGDISLTVEYSVEEKCLNVIYPFTVYPRAKQKYADYTAVQKGDTVSMQDGITVELKGWKPVDSYTSYYLDYNWIPRAKTYSTEHKSEDGICPVIFYFTVHYSLPTEYKKVNLVNDISVFYDGESITPYDGFFSGGSICTGSKSTVSGTQDVDYAVGVDLTPEQMEHPEKLMLTFEDYDEAVCYAWNAGQEEPMPEEAEE